MTILEVYQQHQIMPQLIEHQLKVAGVAKLICDNFEGELDKENIFTACLLHDMGNIIKFDLSVTDKLLPGRFSQSDLALWQEVKNRFVAEFGADEHHASMQIAEKLGVQKRVLELIDSIGFQEGESNAGSLDFGKKICAYSDMRVGPGGVISLEQRFEDLRQRYEDKHQLMGGNEEVRLQFEAGLRQIEKQLFEKCRFAPEDITEEKVLIETEKLKTFNLKA